MGFRDNQIALLKKSDYYIDYKARHNHDEEKMIEYLMKISNREFKARLNQIKNTCRRL